MIDIFREDKRLFFFLFKEVHIVSDSRRLFLTYKKKALYVKGIEKTKPYESFLIRSKRPTINGGRIRAHVHQKRKKIQQLMHWD